MYAHYGFVQYAAVYHYRPFVYVSGVPDWVKPWHREIIETTCMVQQWKKKCSVEYF